MAVIREKRQFRNQKIGVVRIDTGEAQLWNTVAQAADTLTQQAFKSAAVQAEKTGKEFAQSISESSLRTIDPSTGKPQAYQPPSNFGTIAQAAYEETLDRRYIRSVEREIQDKANETYLKYEFDPQGVEKYSQVMEDYVGGMVKNSNGRFAGMVRDTGAAYIASTKFNLMQKRNLRIKEAEQVAQKEDASNAAGFIEALVKTDYRNLDLQKGPQGQLSLVEQDIQETYLEAERGQRAALEAGLITNTHYQDNMAVIRRALPKAMLSKMMSLDAVYQTPDGDAQQMTAKTALAIENSIKTGILGDGVPEALRPQVQKILDSDSFAQDQSVLASHATTLRTNLDKDQGAVRKATEFDIAKKKIVNGFYAPPDKDVNRRAAEDVIRERSGLPEGVSMHEFFTNSKSFGNQYLNEMMARRLMPPALADNFRRILNNEPMSDEAIKTTMNHYLAYSKMMDSDGQINNLTMVAGGLTADEDARMRSAITMYNFRGGDIKDIFDRQRDILQNKDAYDARVADVFSGDDYKGSSDQRIDSFLSKELELGQDYHAKRMIAPLVRHMIAAGHSAETIKNETSELLDSLYMSDADSAGPFGKREPLVADLFNWNPNKSFYALKRVFPDAADRQNFIVEVQDQLEKRFAGKGYVFSAAMYEPEYDGGKIKNVRLVPMPQQPLDINQPIIYMGVYRDKNGDMVPVQDENGLFMVSSTAVREQQLARMQAQQRAIQEEQRMKALNRQKVIEQKRANQGIVQAP